MPRINEGKPKDGHVYPVGLGRNTRISTDWAQTSPRTLFCTNNCVPICLQDAKSVAMIRGSQTREVALDHDTSNTHGLRIPRATSHTSQEPWPYTIRNMRFWCRFKNMYRASRDVNMFGSQYSKYFEFNPMLRETYELRLQNMTMFAGTSYIWGCWEKHVDVVVKGLGKLKKGHVNHCPCLHCAYDHGKMADKHKTLPGL